MSEQIQTSGRETAVFTTPAGKEVTIKTYLTGRERRLIAKVYTDNMRAVTDEMGKSRFELKEGSDVTSKSQDMLVQQAVVSYDGSTDNVVERLLDAPSAEFDFVAKQCDAIGKPENDPKS